MHWPEALSFLLISLLSFVSSVAASTSTSPQNTDIFYWPLSASSPSQASRLAEVSYDPVTLQTSVRSYTPPQKQSNEDLLRIGLFTDASQKHWVGSLTSFSAFNNSAITPNLSLYLSLDNEVYSVAVSASASTASEGNQNLNVEIVRPTPAPTPHLNRPIVLKEDGKETEEIIEKSFIQKYWWAIPIVLFLVIGGGGEAK
ncbi:hypothetical protein CIRG_06478 [Coccidioides immitis RMSCC 2394]|uniref:ER membrane protein complex subunit 10 n=1 Tax=Coccidioides immitis RMSCC 2394 TaxID=404692 RepID=A0A0J7B9U2_COCIT|nr:hypothetical protein CIRG_06478 [Coccidioides immitis RMSCC 2394]